MLVFGDPIIDWSAILKIVIAALIGGCGIVIVYGFLLLGLKYATTAGSSGTPGEGSKVIGYALAAICAILVVGVVVLGYLRHDPEAFLIRRRAGAAAHPGPPRRPGGELKPDEVPGYTCGGGRYREGRGRTTAAAIARLGHIAEQLTSDTGLRTPDSRTRTSITRSSLSQSGRPWVPSAR